MLALTLANENAILLTSTLSNQLAFHNCSSSDLVTICSFCNYVHGGAVRFMDWMQATGLLNSSLFSRRFLTFHPCACDWSMSLRGWKINGLMGKWLWLPTLFPHLAWSICLENHFEQPPHVFQPTLFLTKYARIYKWIIGVKQDVIEILSYTNYYYYLLNGDGVATGEYKRKQEARWKSNFKVMTDILTCEAEHLMLLK